MGEELNDEEDHQTSQGDSPSLRIGRLQSHRLVVRPVGRSYPSASDYWDGNWLDCEVEFRAGIFRGTFKPGLRSDELKKFRDELEGAYKDLRGPASFTNLDGYLYVSATGDGAGHFVAQCVVVEQSGVGPELSFELSFDQTEIPQMLRELDAILRAYPILGEAPKEWAEGLPARVARRDSFVRHVFETARRRIWGPVALSFLAFQVVYLITRSSVPAIESGVLFPIFVLVAIALRHWSVSRLDPVSRDVYREWTRQWAGQKVWPPVMAILSGLTLLLVALVGAEGATNSLVAPALGAFSLALIAWGVITLTRRAARKKLIGPSE